MRTAKGIFLLFSCLIINCLTAPLKDEDISVEVFTNEIRNWKETGYESELFQQYINHLKLPTKLQNADWRTFTGSRAIAACTICKSIMKTLISMYQSGTSVTDIRSTIINLCIRMNLQTERVCRGVIELQMPIIVYIVDANPKIDPIDICGIALQSQYCSYSSDIYDWSIDIDENPPTEVTPIKTEEIIKILQLTDVHYDQFYEPYGNSNCDEPMCCRKGQNITNENGNIAGYWGDYNNCDIPWHTVTDTLDHIVETHPDIGFVYFTGDLIDHGLWETTKEGNIESIVKIYNKINETFKDIPVYSIIGNHEPHPVNLFAPNHVKEENFSTEWLYELSADLWINYGWLPESTRKTILKGGFYTVSPRKGYRVIALNNNVCYTLNWWLLHDPIDPSGQLRWLADTLLSAEKNGEFVHILAHIPSGNKFCYDSWSKQYRKIVDRFSHVITAQFNGHTHFDEFNLYYDPKNSRRPMNVAWNGGSITSYSYLNPNYKVYNVEAKMFNVMDIDTWIFELNAANESPEKRPNWYKSYSFKEEYNLGDLSTDSLHKWIVDASKNNTMIEQYRRNFYKRADPSINQDCNAECLRNYLCNIVRSSSDLTECVIPASL